ncbi:MAG: DUF4915 domain-containing protein [Thermodesulfobacteriota bacterium]
MPEPSFFLTFANQLSSPSHVACVVNPEADTLEWLRTPKHTEGATGASGACLLAPDTLAFCLQGSPPAAVVLRLSTKKILQILPLEKVVDPHSIAIYQDHLYVTSTGTNTIIQLTLDGTTLCGEKLFWRYPGVPDSDNVVHLNGITRFQESFIVSCFGENTPTSSQRNGHLLLVDTGIPIVENLNQPHSPLFLDNTLFVAESGTGKILIFDHLGDQKFVLRAEITTGGYPRGLALRGRNLFVGLSSTRNISKSQQKMLGSQNQTNITSIARIDLDAMSYHIVSDLQPFAREIFDLCIIEGSGPLTQKFTSLTSRVLEMELVAERFFQNHRVAHDEVQRLHEATRIFQSSLSWKVTAPLRWLAGKVGFRSGNDT